MSLPIYDAYRLAVNLHGCATKCIHTRKHRRSREALEAWQDIRGFTSIEDAVNGPVELLLTTWGTETVAEALAEAKNVSVMLRRVSRPHAEVAMREDCR